MRTIIPESPFYVLDPCVADIAFGDAHITSAIGAVMAGWQGTALLCYVSPKEHLGLLNAEDVHEGLTYHNIVAYPADIACHGSGTCARAKENSIH